MATTAQLEDWFSRIRFDAQLNFTDGLDPFRLALSSGDQTVLRFLSKRYDEASPRVRQGVAFVLSEHLLRVGRVEEVRRLLDEETQTLAKVALLNGLWDEPPSSNASTEVLALAIDAMGARDAKVRAEACSVVQNPLTETWRQLRRIGKKLSTDAIPQRKAVAGALCYIRTRKDKIRYASAHAANLTIGVGLKVPAG